MPVEGETGNTNIGHCILGIGATRVALSLPCLMSSPHYNMVYEVFICNETGLHVEGTPRLE